VKIFFDTGVWLRWYGKLPLPKALKEFVASNADQVFLSTTSIYEVVYKWKLGKLPIPDPESWIADSLEGIIEVPPSRQICAQAAIWDWPNRDPFDRIIAASALEEGAILLHTDAKLKDSAGFSQKYFAL
jgi:PIN domain nuclease of toxin-antitoxin system